MALDSFTEKIIAYKKRKVQASLTEFWGEKIVKYVGSA